MNTKNKSYVILLLILTCASIHGQISLLKDVNSGILPNSSSLPENFTVVNTTLYFTATLPDTGKELWKTDGTEQGTVLVKDINPNGSSNPAKLVNVDGTLYFVANDGVNGTELWKSDGTAAGTVMVKDLSPNASTSFTNFSNMVSMNGQVYFAASSPTQKGLWKSNGTPEGTSLVLEASFVWDLANMNGTLYFSCGNGNTGQEPWKSDGTPSGTSLLKDINKTTTANSNPTKFTYHNGFVFFSAYDGVNGSELWKTDGTEAGTGMVKDIWPGADSGDPRNLRSLNGTLYFTANDGLTGYEFWKSDGTTDGTSLVIDINPGAESSFGSPFVNLNGVLLLIANGSIWKSDGTAEGTVFVTNKVQVGYTVVNDGILYFGGYSYSTGVELWRCDGTAEGTTLIKDINPSSNESYPPSIYGSLASLNGEIYFAGYDGGIFGVELWKSDGTTDGTTILKDINKQGNGRVSQLTKVGSTVYFTADDGKFGRELWKTDGTDGGTILVKDINNLALGAPSDPSYLKDINGTLFFTANDGTSGRELWRSDGTAVGTYLVKDINAGSSGAFDQYPYFTNIGGVVYFVASNGFGHQIWKTDGTEAGTVQVSNFSVNSPITELTDVNGILYFTTDDGQHGKELWKVEANTFKIVADINLTGDSTPYNLMNINGVLYFVANDGVNGFELWKTDGTESNTIMVADINPNGSGLPLSNTEMISYNNAVYFSAFSGDGSMGLWKSDGTASGTVRVKLTQQRPYGFKVIGNYLYFTNSNKFWRSDGTDIGTFSVSGDFLLNGRLATSAILNVSNVPYYLLYNENYETELWQITDNLTCRMAKENDVYPSGYDISFLNNKVILSAISRRYGGWELFMYDTSNDKPCKKDQTITFSAVPNKTMGGAPFALGATTTATELSVEYTASPTGRVTISNGQATITGAGRVTVTASQPGNTNYNAAADVTQTFCINPAAPVVTANYSNPEVPVLTSNTASGIQWFKGADVIEGATNATFTVSAASGAGIYKVQSKADDCVSAFSNTITIVITGDLVQHNQTELIVWPNPVADYLTIEGVSPTAQAKMISMEGQEFQSSSENRGNKIIMDVRSAASGVYFVQVRDESMVKVIRVIKN